MIKNIIRSITTTAFAIVLLTPMCASAVTGTGTASLSASPGSGSYVVGNTFSITVRETSSEAVASVEADITYDANLLQCNGVDGSASAFVQPYQNSCGGGSVSIARGTQGTTVAAGTATVATVSFTAIGAGSASLKFAASSDINNANVVSICNTTCGGGYTASTATITAPEVRPPAPTAPTAIITPRTAAPSATTQTTATAIDTPVDAAPTGVVEAASIKLYNVSVTVLDYRGKPVNNATVNFNGKTSITGKNGKANFTAVKSGNYTAKATHKSRTVSKQVTVSSKNNDTQNFMISLPKGKTSHFGLLLGVGTGLLIIGGGIALAMKKRIPNAVAVKKAVTKATKPAPNLAAAKQ